MTNPKIRFKQENCIDFPEWNQLQLNECCNCYDNMRKPIKENLRQKGEYPYYGANGIQDYIDSYIFDGEFILLAEDGGNFNDFQSKAIAKYARGKFWVNNHAHIIQAKREFSNKFIFYSIEHKDIRSYINGSTRGKLTKSEMWNIKIGVPSSIREQQKIASFFSTLDQKIELNERKLEALEKLKKGLMQKIFNQEIRFKSKSGKNFPNWIKKPLHSVIASSGGHTPNMKNKALWEPGEYFWVTPKDMKSEYVFSSEMKISELGLKELKLHKPGTILLVARSGVLKHTLPLAFLKIQATINQDLKAISATDEMISGYLFFFLQSKSNLILNNYVKTGTTVQSIMMNDFYAMMVDIPCLEEQRQIAATLFIFNEKIGIMTQKIALLKQLKQGFMQQMFV